MTIDLTPLTIVYDGNGEPDPYLFSAGYFLDWTRRYKISLSVMKKRLSVGDYTVLGQETVMSVERKKINDLTSRLSSPAVKPDGTGDDRPVKNRRDEFFTRQVIPLSQMRNKAIIIEGDMSEISWHQYRSQIQPNAVKAVLVKLTADFGIPVLFCSDRATAEQMTFLLLMRWVYLGRGVTP